MKVTENHISTKERLLQLQTKILFNCNKLETILLIYDNEIYEYYEKQRWWHIFIRGNEVPTHNMSSLISVIKDLYMTNIELIEILKEYPDA
ncbi:MAG TPA: hypothetical protein ENH82_06760 [bacterium]|nr:hypothetical protein [bacterium]